MTDKDKYLSCHLLAGIHHYRKTREQDDALLAEANSVFDNVSDKEHDDFMKYLHLLEDVADEGRIMSVPATSLPKEPVVGPVAAVSIKAFVNNMMLGNTDNHQKPVHKNLNRNKPGNAESGPSFA